MASKNLTFSKSPKARKTHSHSQSAAASIVQALSIINQATQRHSRQIEESLGVSAAELAAMRELHGTPGMTVSELAGALMIHRATCCNILDELEAKGLVRRERPEPAQRVVHLHLAKEAAALLARAPNPAQDSLNTILRQLPEDESRKLAGILTGIANSLAIMAQAGVTTPVAHIGLGQSHSSEHG